MAQERAQSRRVAAAGEDEFEDFRKAIEERLVSLRIKKQELAAALGVNATWVSQLLSPNTRMIPTSQKILLLSQVLGQDILRELPERQDLVHLRPSPDYPFLWSSRIAILRDEAARDKNKRNRLHGLVADVESAAVNHPLGKAYSHGSRLISPPDLAEKVSSATKYLVLSELAFMKLDAPFSTGITRENVLSHLEYLARDFGVHHLAIKEIARVHKVFKSRLSLETYSALNSSGGAIGDLAFLTVPNSQQLKALVGFDIVGWTDMRFISGGWLVHGLDLQDSEKSRKESNQDVRNIGVFPKWGVELLGSTPDAGSKREVLSSAANSFLGPVASSAVTLFPSNFAYGPSRGNQTDPKLRAVVDTCVSLGHRWVRVELAKLAAFYSASTHEENFEWETNGFPDPTSLGKVLEKTILVLADLIAAERELSTESMRDHDRNRQLKDLVDIYDSFRQVAAYLESYQPLTK